MSKFSIEQQITFLYTKDLDNTTEFYEQILGLKMVLDQGACRIFQVSSDGYLGFCLKDKPSLAGGLIFTIVSENVDEWYQVLVENGVMIEKPPSLNEQYQIHHLLFRDPNGYMIEIQRFLDSEWMNPRK